MLILESDGQFIEGKFDGKHIECLSVKSKLSSPSLFHTFALPHHIISLQDNICTDHCTQIEI